MPSAGRVIEQWNTLMPALPFVEGVDPLWLLVPLAVLALACAASCAALYVLSALRVAAPSLPIPGAPVRATRRGASTQQRSVLLATRPRAPATARVATPL